MTCTHVNIMYIPEWVQVQGLCSGRHYLIRYYMRVKRTVMHLDVSITIPLFSLPGMVVHVEVDIIVVINAQSAS